MNIIVTAVGGDIGQAVVKIIQESNIASSLIGTDCNPNGVGKLFVKKLILLPRADDKTYLKKIEECCSRFKADVIIPISEPELLRLVGIDEISGAKVVMANKKSIEIGMDKLRTYKTLREKGISVPWTREFHKEPLSYPCILKARRGYGSKSLTIIRDQEDLLYYRKKRVNCILQEMLLPDNEEYTCGVFCGKSKRIVSVALHRKLLGGLTGYAEVVQSKKLEDYCHKIAKVLDLRGSINIQLRLTSDGPKVFEINPRFSSTVYFRHKIGFQDLLWSIYDKMNQKVPENIKIDYTKKYFRYYDSIITK